MQDDTLVVASSANEPFALGLLVLLSSIVLSNPVSRIRFHIIDDELLSETKDLIVRKVADLAETRGMDVEIDFTSLSTIPMPEMPVLNGSYSMYARMFFSELFTEPSLFYVDADVLCNRPFPSLVEMESRFSGQLIVGCQDDDVSVTGDQVWSEVHHSGVYVNTGFLWMNLRMIKSFDLVRQLREGRDVIEKMRRTTLHFRDQTLLNCFCHGRIGLISREFNVFGPRLHSGNHLNLDDNWHFTGEIKPWLRDGEMIHLTVPFYLYHVMVEKLGLKRRLPYPAAYLPLSRTRFLMRHLIGVRLWFRSRKRYTRFQKQVKCQQDAIRQGADYSARLDRLWMAKI